MVVKRGKGDFPRVYRPRTISEVYGQEEAKKYIGRGLDESCLANINLFYGASGTGKTTVARIIAMGLNCEKGITSKPCCECESCECIMHHSNLDLIEINASEVTGVDRIREFTSMKDTWPWYQHRIYVFDECHGLSLASQRMLLKVVEDAHDLNFFIFCSTDTKKMIEPLINRCIPIEFKPLPPEVIWQLLVDVCQGENIEYNVETLADIVEKAGGKPRNALYLLQKAVLTLTQPKVVRAAAA